jgi:mannose-6-phosphate isomerase class I
LHLEEGIAAASHLPPPPVCAPRGSFPSEGGHRATLLVDSPHFRIVRHDLHDAGRQRVATGLPAAWMLLDGSLHATNSRGDHLHLQHGETALLPASIGDLQLHTCSQAVWLEISLPRYR